jgi:hypothetical protein
MSKLETNQVDPATGTTLTLGTSGDTISIPSGVTIANSGTATGFGGTMTPAFSVSLSATQNISGAGTLTRVNFNTELLDTDNAYDNSSNYRFTPQTAGKYALFSTIRMFSSSGDWNSYTVELRKNNTAIGKSDANFSSSIIGGGATVTIPIAIVADANGSSDYFDVYFSCVTANGRAEGGTFTNFWGYKIIE